MKLNHLVSLLSRLQLHAESTRIHGYIIYICAFLFGYSGQSCFKTSVSRSPTREAVLSYTQARLHSHMRVHTNQCTGKRRDSYWVASQWERRAERKEGRREQAHERREWNQKVKRKISLLSPKEASPSERGVSRLRNRRETLLIWWFKGDMTSLSSLKSQLVSDSVSQLWREFLLGAWRCSVDCSQEDLQ